MTHIATIVINWNGIKDTEACVESLVTQSQHTDIFIVDNNSTNPQDKIRLKKLSSRHIHIIYNTQNLGFAGGVNSALRHILEKEYSHVALFNNDAIASKDWLSELLNASHQQHSSITTGVVLHKDGHTIDTAGDMYSYWGLPFPRGRNKSATYTPPSGPILSGSGAATLYSREVFEDIGLFDEDFFMYYEDMDLNFRAQLRGHTAYYTSQSIAYHARGVSSNKVRGLATYNTFKNLPLLFIKNIPRRFILKVGMRFWLSYLLMLLNTFRRGQGLYALKGWLTQIPLFWFHAIPERRRIQRSKKVSDDYIKSILWPDLPPDQTGLRKFRSLFTGKK